VFCISVQGGLVRGDYATRLGQLENAVAFLGCSCSGILQLHPTHDLDDWRLPTFSLLIEFFA